MELAAKIDQMWNDLFAESRQVDRSLTDVKKSFTQVRHQTYTIFLHRKQNLHILEMYIYNSTPILDY